MYSHFSCLMKTSSKKMAIETIDEGKQQILPNSQLNWFRNASTEIIKSHRKKREIVRIFFLHLFRPFAM